MSNRNVRYSKRRRKEKNRCKPGILVLILLVLIAAVVAVLVLRPEPEEPEEIKPRLESPAISSSVTVGSTGDMLILAGYEAAVVGGGNYDFSRNFTWLRLI